MGGCWDAQQIASGSGYYPRTLALTSFAGIGRLLPLSLPLARVAEVPVGLSLLGRHGQDALLLEAAKSLATDTGFVLDRF